MSYPRNQQYETTPAEAEAAVEREEQEMAKDLERNDSEEITMRNETINRLDLLLDRIAGYADGSASFRSTHAEAAALDLKSVIDRLEEWSDEKFEEYKVELLVSITSNATSRLESALNTSYSSADQQFADRAKAWAHIDVAKAYGELLTNSYADVSYRDR